MVLKYIAAARERGLGVVLITHNPHHAYLVGDHFGVLRLGTLELSADRGEITLEELTDHMAGGAELAASSTSWHRYATWGPTGPPNGRTPPTPPPKNP